MQINEGTLTIAAYFYHSTRKNYLQFIGLITLQRTNELTTFPRSVPRVLNVHVLDFSNNVIKVNKLNQSLDLHVLGFFQKRNQS